MNSPDKQFAKHARDIYQEACRRIDPDTAARLRAARQHALRTESRAHRQVVRWLIPSGAFAVIGLAALIIWQPLPHHKAAIAAPAIPSASEQSADVDNDLPPDADKADPNLYQNLNFYGWLAANGGQRGDTAQH